MKYGFFSAILLATFLLGCADQKTPQANPVQSPQDFKISRRFDTLTPNATPTIQVFNQANQPIPNAKILIGDASDSPFKGNLLTTDESGFVAVEKWTDVAHVTVDAAGYIRQTLLSQKPGVLQIKMNNAYLTPRPVIKGQVSGLPVNNGDKFIDFALVIPTISKVDLLNFDLGTVISPYSDKIEIILGQEAELPSNISLPTQKESYAFIPVTLSKPEHRVYASTYGAKTYFALTGRFNFKTVVGELQANKKFYEIVNHFTFSTGGLRETTISSPSSQLNIPGNEIKFDAQVAVRGAKVQADEVAISLVLNDLSGGRFVPSDVKRLDPTSEMKLNVIKGKQTYIVSLLKKQSDFDPATADSADRSSATMVPYKAGLQTSLLPLMTTAPTVTEAGGALKIVVPQSATLTSDSKIINPLAVSVSISDINTVQDGAQQVSMLDRKWEVLGSTWPAEINLPAWPTDLPANTAVKRKIEVNLIGSESASQVDLGDDMVKAATHVTHAAAEL